MNRMQAIAGAELDPTARRGYSRQRKKRSADVTARRSAVRTLLWLSVRGLPHAAASERIGLSPRTTREWRSGWETNRLRPEPRGRPVARSDRELRNAIFTWLSLVGPEVTEEQLKEEFPDASRSELRDFKRRYRKVWRRKGATFVSALRWLEPGSVWAFDFTHPPTPVDGIFPAILVGRDLPSGLQLAALPTPGESAETACDLLEALIREHGPPLVTKIDNGPAFRSETFEDLCRRHGILLLFSPPYTPTYNGGVETGNGTLKTHTHYAAARHDRPGEWTCDDVEEGRLRGNAYSRPHGRNGPTPDAAWEGKITIGEARRRRFREVHEEERRKEEARRGILPLIGPSKSQKDAIDRFAISRALRRCGFLIIRRRRITPPVSQRKTAGIT